MDAAILRDLDDDPVGNVQHIAEDGPTPEEVEDVPRDAKAIDALSRSSARPVTFGRNSTGKYLAVVWEAVDDDPLMIRVVTAYETESPKRKRRR